jgi:hypothetical protein
MTVLKADATKQEIFDFVANHLLTQGERAMYSGTLGQQCAYRGAEGRTCAVGCLLEDSELEVMSTELTRSVEGVRVVSLATLSTCPQLLRANADFLAELQVVHDFGGYNYNPWPETLRRFAARHGLAIANVKGLE